MRNLLSAFVLVTASAIAQTAEVHYFLADMRGANEVPAVETTNNAGAVIIAHVMRDAQGQVASGTVEFNLRASFAAAASVTGLHIHNGAAGANGPVVIDSGIRGAEPVAVGAGVVTLQYAAQVKPDQAAALEALRGVVANPNGYYVNLHTTTNPGGQFRAQLYRAESRTFIANLSSANEVPPVATAASGVGSFAALRAYDAAGRYVMGAAVFTANYALGSQQRLTGWHLHRGASGANGPVVLDSGLSAAQQVDTPDNGVGTLQRWMTYQPEAAAAVAALNDLYDNPGAFYMNMHTTTNAGGMIRAQVEAAERVVMSVNMSPANEVPAIAGLDARAVSAIWLDLVRNAAGDITRGNVTYSVNHRFPGEATFTGLHIHEAAAGVNGSVRLDSGLSGAANVASADGFGNITRSFVVSADAGVAALNGLVKNPEGFYLNLHTTVNPGGAVRAQLAAANTNRPTVVDFISGVSDPALRTTAQGGLMTVFGRDLFKVPSNPASLSGLLPSLNGTGVTIGGRAARIWMLGRDTAGNPPDYIVVQAPFDAPAGAQDVVVTNSNGAGAAFRTTVAATAPGIYFDSLGGIALRPDFSLVRPDAAARAGDLIGLLCTGLGQTTPALETGQFAPSSPLTTASQTVTATMAGRDVPVQAAVALPGYAGVYTVVLMVPQGLTPGNAATQIRSGGVASNSVSIPVR